MANGRCRCHGGKSTGPRTSEGKARSAAANTRHGNTTAPNRIRNRYIRTLIQRSKLKCAARWLFDYLPPEMAARLGEGSPELWTPIHPSNAPYVAQPDPPAQPATTRPRVATRPLPRALAAERLAAQAEAASQAPWRHAIATARTAKRQATAAKRAAKAARRAARAANRHPRRHTPGSGPRPPADQLSLLVRELVARKAGLRTRPIDHPTTVPPNPDSAIPRINPMNREPTANPNSAIPGINPMNRENPAKSTHPASTRTAALGTTTLANTWHPTPYGTLATRFSHPRSTLDAPPAPP